MKRGRRPGTPSRCSSCGMTGHNARDGRCSAAYRAVKLVLRGAKPADAAEAVGLAAKNVRDALERRRTRRSA